MALTTTDWDAQETAIRDALARLRELASAAPPPPVHGVVDVVHGSAGAWHAWWTRGGLQQGADVSAIVPDLEPLLAIAAGDSDEQGRDLLTALASGRIRVRVILPSAARDEVRVHPVIEGLAHAGVEVRTGDAREWYFVVRDRIAVVPTTWDEPGDVAALVLSTPPVVAALAEIYERRWAVASPWAAADPAEPVLRALERGLDDAEVAAELGVSVRTVRRRVAEAMAAAGARTRYELAHLRATRRG